LNSSITLTDFEINKQICIVDLRIIDM